jgi:hypothetical protein
MQQGVVATPRMTRRELLYARRGGESEGINALVIVASYKGRYSPRDQLLDELLVDRIQVLIFIDNEMGHVRQSDGIDRSSSYLCQTLSHDLARQHT